MIRSPPRLALMNSVSNADGVSRSSLNIVDSSLTQLLLVMIESSAQRVKCSSTSTTCVLTAGGASRTTWRRVHDREHCWSRSGRTARTSIRRRQTCCCSDCWSTGRYHSRALAVVKSLSSQWEQPILGGLPAPPKNYGGDKDKIWHKWLCRGGEPTCKIW